MPQEGSVCDNVSHGHFIGFHCSFTAVICFPNIHTCFKVSTVISFDFSLTSKVNKVQINLTHFRKYVVRLPSDLSLFSYIEIAIITGY